MIHYVLPTIIPALKDIVHQLAVGDYAGLEERGLIAPYWDGGLSTSADEIAEAIEGYGATLIDIPDEAFATAEAEGNNGVAFNLWTAEEGRSGMTLHVRVVQDVEEEYPRVQIDRLEGFPPKIIPALQEVIHQLVIGDYAGLKADGHLDLSGLTAMDVEEALTDYRDRAVTFGIEAGRLPPMSPEDCKLIDMPTNAFFKDAHAYGGPDEWSVDVDLWWSDERLSRHLTLQATARSTPTGVDVQLRDLHVL